MEFDIRKKIVLNPTSLNENSVFQNELSNCRNGRISIMQQYTSVLPTFLQKILCVTGLVGESDKRSFYLKTTVIFSLVLIYTTVSIWISCFMYYSFDRLQIALADLADYLLVLGLYCTMRCRRRLLSTTLRKVSRISAPSCGKKGNFLTFLLCCFPIAYSASITLTTPDRRFGARFEAYGYETQSAFAQILIISIKSFLYFLVHPTFSNLLSFLYCILCNRCCSMIRNLTDYVLQISPKDFGTSKQIYILRRKARIDDALENLQRTFSMPAFFIIVANFLSCGSVIGWFLFVDLSQYQCDVIIESAFYGASSFSCLTAVLWIASELPVQLLKFKEAYNKKEHLRMIDFDRFEEPQLRRELFEKQEFVLSGCDMIFFKRGTVLAVFGTLLTYTVLIVNAKD
ncbi:hypothetical protein AVEN_135741-1 [Araneus ventricosus]|uniref:Gustatory receptor n=1 Tax=Araneus ventricosus TaxID=182803 RepID=A0A4Y2QI01_ARAVE|nr:hypothetical protein AVEN_28154-1 [Araneus ventricosus]GBN62991.1 hypothetical protein AVEN_135741-1 [Araneus ventricosus]